MIIPKHPQSLQEYFMRLSRRWVISTIIVTLLVGAVATTWMIKTSSEREASRLAGAMSQAFRPMILSASYRDVQDQIQSALLLKRSEGLALVNKDGAAFYEDGFTKNISPCLKAGQMCWNLFPLRISVRAPIYFDLANPKDVAATLELTTFPRVDWSSVTAFASLMIAALLILGLTQSRGLRVLGVFITESLSDWQRRIHNIRNGDHASSVQGSQFHELNLVEGEIRTLHQRIKDLEIESAKKAASEAELGLLRGLGHDFKTPISQLSKFTQILLEKQSKEIPIHESDIQRIRNSLRLLTQLINSVREITDSENKGIGHTDLAKFLSDYVFRMNEERILSNRKKIMFTLKSESTPVALMTQTHLFRIVDNLVRNALESADDVNVKIELQEDLTQRTGLISVVDDGPGIDPIVKDFIFEPHFTTKTGRGTGLGLSVVKKLVSEHGGTIDLDTVPGHGTKITISLPLTITVKNQISPTQQFVKGAV